jgi:hypothetical protein
MKIAPFKFKHNPETNETCFSYLPKLVAEIDIAAQEFLDQFPFVPSDEIAEDIDTRAWKIFRDENEDWESIPEWVADVVDGGVPYCGGSRNGSPHHSIGLSVTSLDAHLRCYWENIKNDTNFILPFPIIAPLIPDLA